MGQRAIIRLGDKTSHDGTVLEGHEYLTVLGKPVAGVGHHVSCPRCSGNPVIIEGAMVVTMLGVPIAVEGMKTSCGATLISSAPLQTLVA